MMPSLFASLNLYGRAKTALIGRPIESRDVPTPISVLGLPVVGSMPRLRILLLLCDAETVKSHPSARRSSSVPLSETSMPVLRTDARFLSTDSDEAPLDDAI